jgi:hypothetical protein
VSVVIKDTDLTNSGTRLLNGVLRRLGRLEINETLAYKMKNTNRDKIVSWLSFLIGGWNASGGSHAGRLVMEEFYNDDEKIIRFLLSEYEKSVTKGLKQEILELKAKLRNGE